MSLAAFRRFHSSRHNFNWITKVSRGGLPKFAFSEQKERPARLYFSSSASVILRRRARNSSKSMGASVAKRYIVGAARGCHSARAAIPRPCPEGDVL